MFYVSDLLDLVVPAELQLPEVDAGGLLLSLIHICVDIILDLAENCPDTTE